MEALSDETTFNFLLNDNLIEQIIKFFDGKIDSKKDGVIKFICSLNKILLDFNPKYIESYVLKLDNPGYFSDSAL